MSLLTGQKMEKKVKKNLTKMEKQPNWTEIPILAEHRQRKREQKIL